MATDDSRDSPYRTGHAQSKRKSGKKRGRGGRGRGGKSAQAKAAGRPKHAAARPVRSHTSHPTTRAAQVSTRTWLLDQYGPVCAYCGGSFSARQMTLDHVAPRRGQSAYDRRDNLVLACRPCNVAKRDQSPLAFLLGLRSRAVNLVKFGAHLSQGLVEMARSLVPSDAIHSSGRANIDYSRWGPVESDDDSPYKR